MIKIIYTICLLALAAQANVTLDKIETFRADTRGFGQVAVTLRHNAPDAKTSWTTFAAEDATHAQICASKRLADLLGFGDLKVVSDSGLPGTVLELNDAGYWLLGVEGSTFHELYAPTQKALKRLAKESGATSWHPVPVKAYPRWLDCFDNAGPGVWVAGGGVNYVLPSDFEWLRDRKLTMCTLRPDESRLVGPGVLDTTVFDWHSAMAAKYDLPYRVLFFPSNHEWLWNRTPLPYVRAASEKTISNPFPNYQANSSENALEPVPAVDPYLSDMRRRLADHLKGDPNYIGMHGCTEIPAADIGLLSAVLDTPGIKALWHGYLSTELGLNLAAVSQLHKGDRNYYHSWDEVEVPRPSDFVGWNPATCVSLRGTWQMHEDTEIQGEKNSWFDPAKAPGDWVDGDGNDPIIQLNALQFNNGTTNLGFWMRRSLTVSAGQTNTLKYLHIARASYHDNLTPLFHVWLNGKRLTSTSIDVRGDLDQCFVVGDALKEGENQIVMNTLGSPIPGYCFLGATPLRKFPTMTEAENRLWYDGINFDAWLRVGKIEQALRATRAADPNRPLKMMAMINLLDLSTPLAEKYGAYQHDTGGAGGYWCPMAGARLARSHGLPFSCEQGGPPNDAAGMQAAMTFYLMYGNDAVDLVFAASDYRDKPDVSAWFDKNLNLIHCIGKMQLPTPKIAVLRSTRATRLRFQEPWNWDSGRGALQSVGRNFAYVDVPDISNGIMDQFAVVIDDGSVLLTEEEVAGIQRYVQRGGTFIAQHHTGQHTPAKANAWPLAHAFGLNVTLKYVDGNKNSWWEWPLGKMRFTEDETLFPSLRGKEIDGSGSTIDWMGQEHTGAVNISGSSSQIIPVAKWADGTMSIAQVNAGRGKFVLLGTPFYFRGMRDSGGRWVSRESCDLILDEFLSALGVPRDSWTGNTREIWAELWRSKNGLYDLYPVARMVGNKSLPSMTNAAVSLRRDAPVSEVVDIGALGHPKVKVQWKEGRMTLPAMDYGLMQSRIFVAPRADIGRAAYDWFVTQAKLWRALPPVPEIQKPQCIAVPEDLLPLADGWTLSVTGQPDRVVSMGAFGTLGLPDASIVAFEKTIVMPAAWKGRRVDLVFDAQYWFWGITPYGKLLVNGKPAAIRQPLVASHAPSFSTDVTEAAATGSLTIRLEIDGVNKSTMRPKKDGLSMPHGATGLFYLQATAPAVKNELLAGPWFVASAVNRLQPVKPGDKVKGLYLETRFTVPPAWPAKRLFIESAGHLGFLVINGTVLLTPSWMKKLDVSGLVFRDGRENVVRWVPAAQEVAKWSRPYVGVVPELSLLWTE